MQRTAQAPVLWPRYVQGPNGRRVTRMVPIDPSQIPPGWQSVQFHVAMRLASCEEVDCPQFLNGWTEVMRGGVTIGTRTGDMTADEAVSTYGLEGPREVAPTLVHHEPGTPCPGDRANQPPVALVNAGEAKLDPRAHKVPSGVPPLYTINGRPVLWNEFEDSIGGGLDATRRLYE